MKNITLVDQFYLMGSEGSFRLWEAEGKHYFGWGWSALQFLEGDDPEYGVYSVEAGDASTEEELLALWQERKYA